MEQYYCITHPFVDFLNILQNSMNGPNFWNAVGAIGQWLGAIATFAAVIVALNTSKLSLSTKMKLNIEPCVKVQAGQAQLTLSWEVVNVGIRPVRPVSAGVIIKNTGKQTVFPGYIKFNRVLEQSERESFLIPFSEFVEGIKKSGAKNIVTLLFYVSDTHGKRHYMKWKNFDWSKIENEHS